MEEWWLGGPGSSTTYQVCLYIVQVTAVFFFCVVQQRITSLERTRRRYFPQRKEKREEEKNLASGLVERVEGRMNNHAERKGQKSTFLVYVGRRRGFFSPALKGSFSIYITAAAGGNTAAWTPFRPCFLFIYFFVSFALDWIYQAHWNHSKIVSMGTNNAW